MSHFAINVFWSDEDGCWVADVPDLAYCSAFGATAQEALAESEIAQQLWLETALDRGTPLPEARYRQSPA